LGVLKEEKPLFKKGGVLLKISDYVVVRRRRCFKKMKR